jgi:hypothetical protein
MSGVPQRVKTPTPPTAPVAPVTPSYAPAINNGVSRNGAMQNPPKPPTTPPLPQLIQQQPLPDPLLAQYNQTLAAYQAAMQQLQGYGPAMNAMQNQITSLTQQSGNNPMQRLLMAQYKGDPYADLRGQMAQMNAMPNRLNAAYYVGDY